tara:strand:- start:729 stop:998 length:270 start_codon:yes stop_codon:yes gene_type:complete
MTKVDSIDAPTGWLIDPHNKWAIHFDYKQLSQDQIASDFTIDMWAVKANGKPMEFKSRRKATRKDSLKTWKQLIESNWVEFKLEQFQTA